MKQLVGCLSLIAFLILCALAAGVLAGIMANAFEVITR